MFEKINSSDMYFKRSLILSIILTASFPQGNGLPSCHANCQFSQNFNEPLIIPDKCNKTMMSSFNLCQVRFELDYTQRTIFVNFGTELMSRQKRTISDVPYDYIIETLRINGTRIETTVFYSCTLGERCEEEYLLSTIPKLIEKNYQDLQKGLIDLLDHSRSTSPLTCELVSSSGSGTCNGTCYNYRSQLINSTSYQPIFTTDSPSCSDKIVSASIQIMSSKTPFSDTQYIHGRTFDYYCANSLCNNAETNLRVQELMDKYYTSIYQK